jgi:ankyrin repeat protein
MNLPPPPQDDDPIITQFRPVIGQWELNDTNIKRIDPKTGETILHNYCEHINTTPLEVYRFLIETKGCDVNVQAKDNDTPFHRATFRFSPNGGGDIAVLQYLLTHKGVNGNIKGRNGNSLLHYSCKNINSLPLEIFKLLVETNAGDVTALDNGKDTPLHYSIRYFNPNNGGDIKALIYLLSQENLNASIKGWGSQTLLHEASRNINRLTLEIFKILTETIGYDVNVQANNKDTSLHYALRHFDPNNGSVNTHVLLYLLGQKGVEANIKDHNGYTLLHTACENINRIPLEAHRFLIETMGCDVNVQDNDKNTPIHRAFGPFHPNHGGDINVLTYLLTRADVNFKNQDGYTLLHRACENINKLPIDIFKLLIETKGCNVNARANNKDTPLHDALRCFKSRDGGDITVLAYLVSLNGINVNIKGKKGHTLLHLACVNNLSDSRRSVEPNAENDTLLFQIVEAIAERCVQQVLGETR